MRVKDLVSSCLVILSLAVIGCAEESGRPNIILILVDTLRADHLGCYGYSKDITPVIDQFASGATLFENAISQAPCTIPSVLQIMTSKYRQGRQIEPQDPTVAELMQAAGYDTAAIVENVNFEFSRKAHGLMRGFNKFYRNGVLDRKNLAQQHWKSNTPADVVTSQAIRWLQKRSPKEPFFLWLHYFDPHEPYMPPFSDDMESLTWESKSEYTGDIRNSILYKRRRFEPGLLAEQQTAVSKTDRLHLMDLYDAEINYMDQSLGELFKYLKDQDVFDDALIVFSSDHGESFGEHGLWLHASALHDPQIHVPLIVKYPGQEEAKRVRAPVQVIDILPTIVDVAGIGGDSRFDGASLRLDEPRRAFAFWKKWKVVREGDWKLLWHDKQKRLFNLSRDPYESRDLSTEEPEIVKRLVAASSAKLEAIETTLEELQATTTEAAEQLRSLGYVE